MSVSKFSAIWQGIPAAIPDSFKQRKINIKNDI